MSDRNLEFIIGRSGNQGFPITCRFVGHEHCRVTFDPESRYFTVEDLNSSNGTYIMDDSKGFDNLTFLPIERVSVPMGTWINLGGTEPGTGIHVLLDHLLSSPDDFSAEFCVMNQKLMEYHSELEDLEKKQRNSALQATMIRGAITLGLVVALLALFPQIPGVSIAAGVVGSSIVALMNSRDKKRDRAKKLKQNANLFFVCPKCGRPLNEFSIKQRECASCKAH